MKGWVGLVDWPVADGLPTVVVTHQLQVERGTGKVRRPETDDVLPLCHATNRSNWINYWCRRYKVTELSGVRRQDTVSGGRRVLYVGALSQDVRSLPQQRRARQTTARPTTSSVTWPRWRHRATRGQGLARSALADVRPCFSIISFHLISSYLILSHLDELVQARFITDQFS